MKRLENLRENCWNLPKKVTCIAACLRYSVGHEEMMPQPASILELTAEPSSRIVTDQNGCSVPILFPKFCRPLWFPRYNEILNGYPLCARKINSQEIFVHIFMLIQNYLLLFYSLNLAFVPFKIYFILNMHMKCI